MWGALFLFTIGDGILMYTLTYKDNKYMNKQAYETSVRMVLEKRGLNKEYVPVGKTASAIPYEQALDEQGYDKIRRDDDFITGDSNHRYITAPTSRRRYNIDKLPDRLQDIIYERIHLGNLMRAYSAGDTVGYLNRKQQEFFNSWTDNEAKLIHNRKRALEKVIDALLSRGRAAEVPKAPPSMYDIIYNAGGENKDQ